MAETKGVRVEQIREYLELEKQIEEREASLAELRQAFIADVLKRGSVPEKATKATALTIERYELIVTRSQSVEVNTPLALELRAKCGQTTFRRLFRKVEKYVVAKGAAKLISSGKMTLRARAIYAEAVKVKEKKPALRVIDLEAEKKGKKAA